MVPESIIAVALENILLYVIAVCNGNESVPGPSPRRPAIPLNPWLFTPQPKLSLSKTSVFVKVNFSLARNPEVEEPST